MTRRASARPFALHIANSLWGSVRGKLVPSFLDTLAVDYGAGVELVDFGAAPAGATRAINAWASDATGTILFMGRIADPTG